MVSARCTNSSSALCPAVCSLNHHTTRPQPHSSMSVIEMQRFHVQCHVPRAQKHILPDLEGARAAGVLQQKPGSSASALT